MTALSATVLLASLPAASGAVLLQDLDLGAGTQATTVWTNLTNTNAGTGSSLTPDSGTGTATVGAPGFKASFGLYSFSTDYSVTFSQGAEFDIRMLVFQLELAVNPDVAWGGDALLSINGGAYELAADVFGGGLSEVRSTFGAEPVTYLGYAWQWDLSGIAEEITSVSVRTPLSVHSSATAGSMSVGSAFNGYANVVPEPSVLLVSLSGLGLMLIRRR